MIITRTPLRVSFFGGGTDYPEYFLREGGQVLATAIDKFLTVIVLELAPFFDYRVKVHYSRIESVRNVQDIEISVVREVLKYLDIGSGVEIYLAGQLPARTGLGSSSATTVGLLMALHAFKGNPISPGQAAEEAVHVERNMICEPVGYQDQHTCASGGIARLRFRTDGAVEREVLNLRSDRRRELEASLLLFYTGLQRSASQVLQGQVEATKKGALDEALRHMRDQVDTAVAILAGDDDLDDFGRLLADAWTLKKSFSNQISSASIDAHYERAIAAGALGGKVVGAGAGGFLLIYAPHDRQPSVRRALCKLREVPFSLEKRGTRIIYDTD